MILNLKLSKTRKHDYLLLSFFDLIGSLGEVPSAIEITVRFFFFTRNPDTHAAMHHGTVYEQHFVQIDGKISVLIYIG